MDLVVNLAKSVAGTIKVPGDKSISHRALMIGALAEGVTSIHGFLKAADCLSTLSCLKKLGVNIKIISKGVVEVDGVGLLGFKQPSDILDVGNSGTTLRILPGVLAAQNFNSSITGDESIRKRPIDRIIRPLRQMGADITAIDDLYAPIEIHGRPLHGISYVTPVPSAQIKSAVLLAGLLAEGTTTVEEKAISRDHSERMLQYLGAEIVAKDKAVTIRGRTSLKGSQIIIPGDISSAAFFIVGALITPNSRITVQEVGVNPTRMGLVEVLLEMGGIIDQFNWFSQANEPRADLAIESSQLKGTTIKGDIIPQLIDELPIIAVAATQAQGTTIVEGAGELRIKETDRISAINRELCKMGAKITEKEDGFTVNGPTKLRGTVVDSYGDHRMAMALAIAGTVAEGKTVITNSECIGVSFPEFEEMLKCITSNE